MRKGVHGWTRRMAAVIAVSVVTLMVTGPGAGASTSTTIAGIRNYVATGQSQVLDLTLTLPRRLAESSASMPGVRVVEPPHEIKGFSYFMVWHPRLTAEPAHAWFREQLRMAARTL